MKKTHLINFRKIEREALKTALAQDHWEEGAKLVPCLLPKSTKNTLPDQKV